ncbi:MAG: Holliday junction resolvase RuvX [Candidatus Moranbacteria bacterium]|nr:Holliday junction resolvase RuvX [Candidatus Moranbacteria bacterium]
MSIDPQNSAEISHILGIDFGEAKIGLAVADLETKIASAYKTLENNDKLLAELAEIIREKEINKIILGVTEYNNQADEKKKFGEMLKDKLGLPVEYQNEMFTTKMAQDNIKETGIKNIKRFDNQEAARIILQSWLDAHST